MPSSICYVVNTRSARQVAELAGTSAARVLRAANALGYGVGADAGQLAETCPRRKRRFTQPQTETLLTRLASDRSRQTGVAGLRDTDLRALAALAHAPLGLSSVRAVGRAAGLSPGAGATATRRLCDRVLATAERHVVAEGAARERVLLTVNVSHPDWAEIAPHLQRRGTLRSRPDRPDGAGAARRVPARLAHVFWNEDLAVLEPVRHGALIASRVLQSGDPQALAWASMRLRARDWERAAHARGTGARDAALAGILARQ